MSTPRIAYICAFLLVLPALSGCGPDKSDIDTWRSQGSASEIEEFVSSSLHDNHSDEIITHGIEALIEMKADSSLRRLGSEVGKDIPQSYTKHLIHALNQRSILPGTSSALCHSLIRGQLVDNADLVNLLERHADSSLDKCIVSAISHEIDKPIYENVRSYLDNVRSYNFNTNSLLSVSQNNLRRIDKYSSKVAQYSHEVSKLEKKITDTQKEIDNLKDVIDDLLVLRGYVVGLIEDTKFGKVYEIADIDKYGNITNDHSYLITKEASFRSKGRFTMRVNKSGKVDTKLRDEYGGFKQKWDVYIESSIDGRPSERLSDKEEKLEKLKNNFKYKKWTYEEANMILGKSKRNVKEIFDGDKNFDIRDVYPINSERKDFYGIARLQGGSKALIVHSKKSKKIIVVTDTDIDTVSTKYKDTIFSGFEIRGESLFYTTTDDKYMVFNEWSMKEDRLGWMSVTRKNFELDKKNYSEKIYEYRYENPEASTVHNSLKNMRYSEARKSLVTSGWIPNLGKTKIDEIKWYPFSDKWTEVKSCSQGAFYCNFEFTDASGDRLEVTTQGEVEDPVVVGWDKE